MLKDHIIPIIKKYLGHLPTPGQEKLMAQLTEFIINRNEGVFIIKGYAGTGKTTLVSALVRTLEDLRIKSLLLAPTGRASKVFSSYAGKIAYTIHRKIYRQESSKDGFGSFVLNINTYSNTVIIVDEASMITNNAAEDSIFGSGRLLDDLIAFTLQGRNCRLILIGDIAQLPPVGTTLSPALDRNELLRKIPVAGEGILTDIVRQTRNSGILLNATIVRNQITKEIFLTPALKHVSLPDVRFIAGTDLVEVLEKAYNKYGINDTIIVCRSNKRANQYNSGIRKQVLYRDEELAQGDLLMVVKNNYFWLTNNPAIDFIANGDIVQVKKVIRYIERYDFRFALTSLKLTDYDLDFEAYILLNTLTAESAALNMEDNKKLYYNILEDFKHLKTRSSQYKMVKGDPFFNALQVKYAYAATCHKAQGGQWKAVFIDQGYISDEKIDLEYLRWLYTAITRATHELYLVNFPKEFLEDAEGRLKMED
jgi:exodeoxyribonuclease-5